MASTFLDPRGPLTMPAATYSTVGQQIIYVHNSGASLDDLPAGFSSQIYTSVNDALTVCRSGRGDIIQLLPGHTESIDAADKWSSLGTKTGITVLGPHSGTPATFTWTAAASQIKFDTNGFVIDGGPKRNIVLNLDAGTGTVNTAEAIAITAAYCGIANCRVRAGTDANAKVTLGITLSDAADDCFLVNNHCYGATTAECTTMVDIAGADRLFMARNIFSGATSNTGVGIVRFKTTAATHVWLADNAYANRKASSTMAVTGVASVSGFSFNELFHYLDNTTTTMWGTSPGDMAFYNPRTVNLAGEAGMLSTVVSTSGAGPMAYTAISFDNADDGGIQTEFGTLLSPGGRAFYVHHSGGRSFDQGYVRTHTYTTLNDGLKQCASGNGDTVFVLPGHAENITTADQMNGLVAGTNIIGLGFGNNRPTFTWTVASATFLLDVANVFIKNVIFNMDPGTGTTTVTAPMTVSAAGCGIMNCRMRTSTDANSLSTVPIALTDAADQFTFVNNHMFGATAGECTTQLDIAGADDLVMRDNTFLGATSSTTVGIVRFKATAATNVTLVRNSYINKKAASAAAVTGVAGVTGYSYNELFGYLDNTSTTMWITSPGLMHFFNPRTSNLAGEAGMLSTVVST
jgi:hypothetical protein